MPVYEYQFGVYVEATDEQAAWEKVRQISEMLDEVDAEGHSEVEGPFVTDIDIDTDSPAFQAAVETLRKALN